MTPGLLLSATISSDVQEENFNGHSPVAPQTLSRFKVKKHLTPSKLCVKSRVDARPLMTDELVLPTHAITSQPSDFWLWLQNTEMKVNQEKQNALSPHQLQVISNGRIQKTAPRERKRQENTQEPWHLTFVVPQVT
jgi:hypothetical protein